MMPVHACNKVRLERERDRQEDGLVLTDIYLMKNNDFVQLRKFNQDRCRNLTKQLLLFNQI